jgi:hypothetical protein
MIFKGNGDVERLSDLLFQSSFVSSAPCSHQSTKRLALLADYPLTSVGIVMFKVDFNRITKPGAILAVRLPGIYADVAN